MGQFGGLDIKTSQEPNLGKKWNNWSFKKNSKWDITVVSEHDLGTWCGLIFMSTIIQWPPLYIETKSAFVEEETMTRDKRGTSYDGEEIIKSMEPIFEEMKNNIMKEL